MEAYRNGTARRRLEDAGLMLSPDHIAEARRLRSEGASWAGIAKNLGVGWHAIRRAIDPAYAAHERHRNAARRIADRKAVRYSSRVEETGTRLSGAEVDRMRRRLPPDTRTPMAVLLGDPRPGREMMEVRNGE